MLHKPEAMFLQSVAAVGVVATVVTEEEPLTQKTIATVSHEYEIFSIETITGF